VTETSRVATDAIEFFESKIRNAASVVATTKAALSCLDHQYLRGGRAEGLRGAEVLSAYLAAYGLP
jgi:hypothetical protein